MRTPVVIEEVAQQPSRDAVTCESGVDAEFSLGEERLAWPVDPALGEIDFPEVYAVPATGVVAALRRGELAFEL